MFKIIKNWERVKTVRMGYRELANRFCTKPGKDNCGHGPPNTGLVVRVEHCTNVTINIISEEIKEIHVNNCSNVKIVVSPKPSERKPWSRVTDYLLYEELPRTVFAIASEVARTFL